MKSKEERQALRTGVDENFIQLHYACPQCGWTISLMEKHCPKCGNKRPVDAYESAIATRDAEFNRKNEVFNRPVYVDRSVQKIPGPKAPCYAAPGVDDVKESCYANNQFEKLGVAKYYSTDEYGRVFEVPLSYQPVQGGGPVPVPKPSRVIQTGSIQVPVNFNINNNNREGD